MITIPIGEVITPQQAMQLAINEGKKGAGFVAPNPLVGCTIVDREHRLLAVGYHRKIGFDHAEIDALKKLPNPSLLQDAHVYVTLEPCAHQGRTPSCARTLAPLKPRSVTYAVKDPNPLVSGQGAEILREAGVDARVLSERSDIPENDRDELTAQAEELAEIFLHNFRTKTPFIAVKVASSLDGKMALVSGESKWITGEKAREHVHAVRAQYDAVAVGRNTFVADDPSLNVRHANFPGFKNKAVLFDPQGRALDALKNSNLLKVRDPQSVFVVVGESVKASSEAKLIQLPLTSSGQFDTLSLLQALRAEGLSSIMIEGGARTIGAFMSAKVVKRLHVYLAPSLLGGKHGLAWSSFFGEETMSGKTLLQRSQRLVLGDDLYWTGIPNTAHT